MALTMRRSAKLLSLLFLLLLVEGCAALQVREPTVALRSADVGDISAQGLTTQFQLDVSNPNAFALPLQTANYALSLGGAQVVNDSLTASSSVPAQGSLPVTVPVHLRFDQLLSAEQAIVHSGGDVPFDFNGSLAFTPGHVPLAGPIKVPVHFTGTLPFRTAAQRVEQNPRLLLGLLNDPNARHFLETALGHSLLGSLLPHSGQ